MSSGLVRSRAGLSFPDSDIPLGAMQPKDWKDLEFGLKHGIDLVGLSFVKNARDLNETCEFVKDQAHPPMLVAKIERREAVQNIDEILRETDGIMVARGDLGINIPIERVPTIQKELLQKARKMGRFAITATQMLESMVDAPMPTRAEVTDVANAIHDGTDAVMLSGETAVGNDPSHTVATMVRIIEEAEANAEHLKLEGMEGSIEAGIVQAIQLLVEEIDAKIVFAPYTTGSTASRISRLRVGVPIIAGTPDDISARRLNVRNGVFAHTGEKGDSMISKLQGQIDYAVSAGIVKRGDRAVATGGFPLDKPGNTNFLRALTICEEL